MAAEVKLRLGEIVSSVIARVTEVEFVAKSVWVRVIFFVPSPVANVSPTLKVDAVQVVVAGDVTPEPEITTVRPVSQVPVAFTEVVLT